MLVKRSNQIQPSFIFDSAVVFRQLRFRLKKLKTYQIS